MARRVIYKLISRLLFTKWHDKQDVALLSSNVSPEEPSRAAQRRKRRRNIDIQKPTPEQAKKFRTESRRNVRRKLAFDELKNERDHKQKGPSSKPCNASEGSSEESEASSSLEESSGESGPENFGVDEVTKNQELPPLFQLKPGKEQLFRLLVESLLRIIMGALWEGNDNHFEKAQTYWEGLINTKKESLVANSRWRDYKEKLKKCKVVNFRFLKLTMEHQQCEACLMPRFLTECVVCDGEKFKVCQSCSARGSVYHDLHHYKQPLEKKCTEQLKKVQEMAGTEKPEGIIKKCLDDEGWLDGLFSHFQSTLNAANKWAID